MVNKTRSKTSNNSLVPAVAKDSGQLKKVKVKVSFSQFKITTTEKIMDRKDTFSNYVHAEIKVDETSKTYNCVARKNNRKYAKAVRYFNTLTYGNTTDLLQIY